MKIQWSWSPVNIWILWWYFYGRANFDSSLHVNIHISIPFTVALACSPEYSRPNKKIIWTLKFKSAKFLCRPGPYWTVFRYERVGWRMLTTEVEVSSDISKKKNIEMKAFLKPERKQDYFLTDLTNIDHLTNFWSCENPRLHTNINLQWMPMYFVITI